jgi:hypothetical protein
MKTTKQITLAIKSINGRSKTLREDIQSVLIDIAGHMVAHSEVSLATKLLNDVGNGANKVAIAVWLRDYTAYVGGDKPHVSKAFMKDVTSEFFTDENGCNMEAAEAHIAGLREEAPNWWEDGGAQEDKVAKVFDALLSTETLINNIAKKTAKGEGTHLDLDRYLKEAVAKYKEDRAMFEEMARTVEA